MVLVPVAQMMEIARRRHASVTLPAKHSAKKSISMCMLLSPLGRWYVEERYVKWFSHHVPVLFFCVLGIA